MAGSRQFHGSRRLRTRVRNAIASVAAIALLLFGVPLAVVVARLITSEAVTTLQRDATRAVAAVPDNVLESGQSLAVPSGHDGVRIAVYDARGTRVAGAGPARSALAAAAGDGREHDGRDGGDLAVIAPVLSDTAVAGSVRAAIPRPVLRARIYRAWSLLLGLAALVVVLAWVLARRAAGRLSRPFEMITQAARELGGGRFTVDLPPSGVAEADAASEALHDSARQIDALVEHERAFMRDASHQLRTPLSALVVQLEHHPPDLDAAVASVRHLERTIDDLLALRTSRGTEKCDASDVAREAGLRWTRAGNLIELRLDDVDSVAVSAAALRQSLDVLIDNALRHGLPPVVLTVESYGDMVLVEVADEGSGFADESEPGTGLQLAARLVEQVGGSLVVRRRRPQARVALLLPATPAGETYSTSSR